MQLHLAIAPRTLQPNRGQVADADNLARLHFLERIIHQRLGRIEGVGPARSFVGLPLDEAEAILQHQEPLAHERDRVVAHDRLVEQIVFAPERVHLAHEAVGVETRVGRAVKNEALETFEIDRVGRHPGVKRARALRRLADGAGMAGGAIQKDAIDPLGVALGDADRQIPARLVNEA